MSQLLNRKADQKIEAKFASQKRIEHEAAQWITQGDADALVEHMRDAANTRKNLISVLDLSSANRTARLIITLGILVLILVTAWSVWNPDAIVGLALYGMLAAGALGSVIVLLGVRRLREVQRLDDVFPSIIEAENVQEAAMTCETLGEQRGASGALFIATAAAIEGALAGFVVSAAFGNSVPAILQLVCAGGSAALLVLSTNLVADYFADRVRALRARYRIRRTKRIDFKRFPHKKEELAFLSRILEPLIDDDHTRPTWKEWSLAFAALGVVGLLYAMLVALRLWGPAQNGMDPFVVIGFSLLCVLIAWIGCAFRGMGALLPDRQRVDTMIHKRFPSVESFVQYKQQQTRSIERWANKVVRAVRLAYVQRIDSGDDRWVDPNIKVREPFDQAGALDADQEEISEPMPAVAVKVPEDRTNVTASTQRAAAATITTNGSPVTESAGTAATAMPGAKVAALATHPTMPGSLFRWDNKNGWSLS